MGRAVASRSVLLSLCAVTARSCSIQRVAEGIVVGSWRLDTAGGTSPPPQISMHVDGTCAHDSQFASFAAGCNAKVGPDALRVTTCHWGIERGDEGDEVQVVLDTKAGFVPLMTAFAHG